MCLYPTLIKNRKYTANKKNGGIVPPVRDDRVLWVPIGCQDCLECRKQKAREWQIRMLEDIKEHKNGKFVTLTFSNEAYRYLVENPDNLKACKILEGLSGYELDNEVATIAMRLFLERWRKRFKKSCRHWIVTELGHNGTENVHLHGILWTDESFDTIKEIWNYGYIWPGDESRRTNYVSEATVNYITKYVTKQDTRNRYYKAKILTSAGIGNRYTKINSDHERNRFNGTKTIETYRTKSGHKMSLPIYWRNKIYTEEERELLWLQRLDKQERWVCGEKIDISNGWEQYDGAVAWHRQRNARLGYGNGQKSWDRFIYEQERRNLQNAKRLAEARRKGNSYQRCRKKETSVKTPVDTNCNINTIRMEEPKIRGI